VSDPAVVEGGVISLHAGIRGGADLVPGRARLDRPVAGITVAHTG
jgi:hypothetical protein